MAVNGGIAYIDQATTKVMVTNATGTLRRSVGGTFDSSERAAWSPNGRRIAVGPEIMNPDGSGAVRLPFPVHHPTWSPDGQRIAFIADIQASIGSPDRHRNYGTLMMAPVDNSASPTPVTDRAFIGYPAWSPDGASLAYSRDRQGATATEIVRHHLASGRQDIIVGPQPGLPEITMAAWSPDGRQLVFTLINTVPDSSGTLGQIITINSDGSSQRVVVSSREHRLAFPCWSPDGLLIAYTEIHSLQDETHTFSTATILVVPATGGTPRTIAPGTGPSWATAREPDITVHSQPEPVEPGAPLTLSATAVAAGGGPMIIGHGTFAFAVDGRRRRDGADTDRSTRGQGNRGPADHRPGTRSAPGHRNLLRRRRDLPRLRHRPRHGVQGDTNADDHRQPPRGRPWRTGDPSSHGAKSSEDNYRHREVLRRPHRGRQRHTDRRQRPADHHTTHRRARPTGVCNLRRRRQQRGGRLEHRTRGRPGPDYHHADRRPGTVGVRAARSFRRHRGPNPWRANRSGSDRNRRHHRRHHRHRQRPADRRKSTSAGHAEGRYPWDPGKLPGRRANRSQSKRAARLHREPSGDHHDPDPDQPPAAIDARYRPAPPAAGDTPVTVRAGQPLRLDPTIAAVSPSTGAPAGTITYTDHHDTTTRELGTAALRRSPPQNRPGRITITLDQPGKHRITATYQGNDTFTPSQGAVTVDVTPSRATEPDPATPGGA